MDGIQLLLGFFMSLLCIVRVSSLSCWHCIADDCDTDPSDNYKAMKKPCNPEHSCQKVYFEMFSETEKRGYKSTVRGCSPGCTPRDDFLNCTTQLKNSRGCIRKDCCDDNDLCNGSDGITTNMISYTANMCLLVIIYTIQLLT